MVGRYRPIRLDWWWVSVAVVSSFGIYFYTFRLSVHASVCILYRILKFVSTISYWPLVGISQICNLGAFGDEDDDTKYGKTHCSDGLFWCRHTVNVSPSRFFRPDLWKKVYPSFPTQRMVGRGRPLYLKFWAILTPLEQNCRFSVDIGS